MSSKNSGDEEDIFVWTLDTIPPEIFLHICSFLSAKFVINVLSSVCQEFKDIISSDTTWRMRIRNRWPKKYPIVSACSDFDWKAACIAREEHHDLWQNAGENMKRYHFKEAHFGCVNVVNIVEDGSICVSGGRDGAFKLWDLGHLNELPLDTDNHSYDSCLLSSREAAHNAWLWSIAYDNNNKLLYTGGFDCNLKTWQLEDTSVPSSSYSLPSPILCLSYSANTLVSGCFGRSVSLFDHRVGMQPVFQHIHHKKPVLCIVSDEKYIISGSEDKTVIVYDKVARRVLKTLQFEGFPLSMSYEMNQLLVGDVLGSFHVIDSTKQDFESFQSYETGHKLKVTGIQQTLGSIITSSTDKTIRILEPSVNPQPIAVIQCNEEVAKISTYNTTLASANTDDSITIWLPKGELN